MTPTASTATELIHMIRSPHFLHVNVKKNAIIENTLLQTDVNSHVFAHVSPNATGHTMLISNTHVAGAIGIV